MPLRRAAHPLPRPAPPAPARASASASASARARAREGSPARRAPAALRLAWALCAALLATAAAAPASAESRIAVVDVQHAVMQTEDGIRAQATLKKDFDRRQRDLDAKQNELQRAREDIERQSRVLSREALQKRMEDWQRQMVELQTVFVDYNKQLQKKQGELTGPIIKKMMGIIGRLAKKNGYELILDKQAAPYARADLDLTEQVIQLYNSGGEPADAGGDKAEKEETKEVKKEETK